MMYIEQITVYIWRTVFKEWSVYDGNKRTCTAVTGFNTYTVSDEFLQTYAHHSSLLRRFSHHIYCT